MQDIYVDDTGKGKPLVLIHGFLGSSDMWRPQIKYFKKNYRVLSPALPGFGALLGALCLLGAAFARRRD